MEPVESAPMPEVPAGYPAHFDTDVVLSDGQTARVRPILPSDGARLLAFHAKQSPESIYFRYFSPRPRLSDRDVEHLTNVDYVDRMALVALHGDEMIGVARYDRLRNITEAEVAFFVDDANQGRGLATVMLEHLAVRAREVGVTGFTATVLPENRKMIGVFVAAGFAATTRFADGVVEVTLGIEPTPEAQAAIDTRARRAAAEAVRRLLSPRSVAVIGASRTRGSIGHELFRNLQRAGFQGPLWPVNPQAEHVGSVMALPSILDVPGQVDLAVVAVPAEAVPAVVEECGRKQVYGVVVLSSGFAESGPEGAALEAEVLRIARSWGIRLVGPNCLGVVNTNPDVRLHATFAPVVPRSGGVALLSESGMVGAAIMAQAREVGIGISSFLALGNRADVSGNDLLGYWEDDERTSAVCMYIESFGNARHFSRIARRLSRAKPVVAVKASGASDKREAALLSQTGVIQVPTLTHMLDTVRVLSCQPLPRGRRVAIVGNAGGSLAIAGDAAERAGLELSVRSSGEANPLDLGLAAREEDFVEAVEAAVADRGVDNVLVVYAPSLGSSPTETRAALDRCKASRPAVPIAACFFGPDHGPNPEGDHVPVFGAVDAAASALGRVAAYAEWLGQREQEPAVLEDVIGADAEAVRAAVASLLADGPSRDLTRDEAADLLAGVGASIVDSRTVTSAEEAVAAAEQLGYPVVLKAARRDRRAKTVAGGFALDLADEIALRTAWTRMVEHLEDGVTPALVQPMLDPGVDIAVDVLPHPDVGPYVAIGAGGASALFETRDDMRVLPISDVEARQLIDRSRLATVLPVEDRKAVAELILVLGALVDEVPEIAEIRLNPVVVSGGRAVLTDLHVRVAPLETEPLPPLRRV